jgi:energy-coupling factor transporter transmembrane protein EcfT
MLWIGEANQVILRPPDSSSGLEAGLHMALRAVVVILAVDGFSSSVDIAEVAGLLERVGLPGLGFSMGVAVNLLPALRESSQNTWRSLQMRGGFRHRWWQGLRLLLVTVVANALRRAEEIALAAEVRAFSPERSRALSIKMGAFDLYIVIVLLVCWLIFVFVI